MSVQQLWVGGAFMPRADLAKRAHVVDDHRALFVNAALCHNLKEVDEQGQQTLRGDPMEIALAEIGRELAGDLAGFSRVDEIPFDTDRKRMSVICETPQGRMLYCKGALETVLAGCRFIQFDAGLAPLDPAARTRLLAAQDEMAGGGLRVLAFAHRAIDEAGVPGDEQGMILAGLIGLEDPPRAEVPEAIARCKEAGIRIIMVTGDHPRTGLAIARQIGLVMSEAPVVVNGEQLRLMSPTQLQLALDAPEILFARVAAEQKMRIVEALKNKGEIVAVTGDGVNDAPALKAADIGIAMGISGTDVAKEAADLILLDDNFASIVAAIEEGRAVFENIRKFLTYILSSNIPELVPFLAFVLFRIPLALTIIQILAVDLGTDMLPALALGAEKPDPGVMKRPRARAASGCCRGECSRVPTCSSAYSKRPRRCSPSSSFSMPPAGSTVQLFDRTDPLYLQATSACLATIVVMQMVNLYLCRHPRRSSLSYGFGGNRYLQFGIVAELAVILFHPVHAGRQLAFRHGADQQRNLAAGRGCAALMWTLEELRKAACGEPPRTERCARPCRH
jgi:sodium/potassium-transporting ATPase subunit alpha